MSRIKNAATDRMTRGRELPSNKYPLRPLLGLAALLLVASQCAGIPTMEIAFQKAPAAVSTPHSTGRGHTSNIFEKLPMSFEANLGQTDARVRFLARMANHTVFLTSDEVIWVLRSPIRDSDTLGEISQKGGTDNASNEKDGETAVFRMRIVGARPDVKLVGEDGLPVMSNYFVGNDREAWRTNVPHYAKVRYEGVYSGIDLVLRGDSRRLEYDFLVAPGANPEAITMSFEGAEAPELDTYGNLVLHYSGGSVQQFRPVIYQENEGAHREIAGGFVLKSKYQIGFQVAAYDASKNLVIDPILRFSTYLGGSDGDEGAGIAVDSSGNAFILGNTRSVNFPMAAPIHSSQGGGSDVFVAKLNSKGTALVYCSYLGGSGQDASGGIALDACGNAYVTGRTSSSNFPTTSGALQTAHGGGFWDAFVTKLSADGSALVYSTYLGGSADDQGNRIAPDASGNAYVVGMTSSADFGTTAGAFQTAIVGNCYGTICLNDVFITKLNFSGSALIYSTYLGGSGDDEGIGIAVDSAGNAYITGITDSTEIWPGPNFPTTNGAFQSSPSIYVSNSTEAFVTKINTSGSALVYSTFLGGGGIDEGESIAVDSVGNAYLTGNTGSPNFPISHGALDEECGTDNNCNSGHDETCGTVTQLMPCRDVFLAKLNPMGSALLFSTFFGGSRHDVGTGVAVDVSGNAYITGFTDSADFPIFPSQENFGGYRDAFAAKFNSTGNLVYSVFLGGSNYDTGAGIALDRSGNAYLTGYTLSTDFRTASPLQESSAGSGDAFVAWFHVDKGDVNSDGYVDLIDAVLALQVVAQMTQAQIANYTSDVNGDGKIGSEEVIWILQKISGLR
jgi:hypothetical protein